MNVTQTICPRHMTQMYWSTYGMMGWACMECQREFVVVASDRTWVNA